MKKIIIFIICLLCFSAKSIQAGTPYVKERVVRNELSEVNFYVYYHSSLFCPNDKPIRKGNALSLYGCFLSNDIHPIHYKYYKIGNEIMDAENKIICQIPEDARDESYFEKYIEQFGYKIKWQMDLKEEQRRFLNVLKNKNMEYEDLSFHDSFCYSYVDYEDFFWPEFLERFCTEEELARIKKINESIIENNTKVEKERMKNYRKDCFSCEDEISFWTDKETCDLCPNREMNGNECVLRKGKK